MTSLAKYKIEKAKNEQGIDVVVVTSPDARSVTPSCGEDLLAVYKYEISISKGDETNAQRLLADAIDNQMPITRLLSIARGEVCAPQEMSC